MMESTMRVTVLLFQSVSALFRAFDSVMEEDEVASCLIEPEYRRIRFVAPRKASDELIEAIYQQGGLVWCSRHALEPVREDQDDERTPPQERVARCFETEAPVTVRPF